METFQQTKRRKSVEYRNQNTQKRQQNTGSETIAFLREVKQEKMSLKKVDHEIQKEEQRLLQDTMRQQNQQTQQLIASQQLQNQALMALIAKLADKNT